MYNYLIINDKRRLFCTFVEVGLFFGVFGSINA